MNLSALFEPALLIFTIPMMIATAFGVLALVGLFDFEALDADVDLGSDFDLDADFDVGPDVDLGSDVDFGADLDADAGFETDAGVAGETDVGSAGGSSMGSNLMQLLGLGLIPLSLLLVIVLFSFGWIGLLLVSLFGSAIAGVVGGKIAVSLVLSGPALVGAFGVASPMARLLQPLFRDYGKATEARRIVGKIGTVSTSDVSPEFGSASVTLPGRGTIEISARATDAHAEQLAYGDQIVVYDYDPESNVYFVAPFDEDEV